MIQAFGLTSNPRKGHPPAVDDVSFEAHAGRVTVLLGAEGAGKTTALRLMLELQQGRGITYFRGRPLHQIAHPSREVGVLLGDVPGHPARSVRGHLRMLCAAAGVPVRRADEVLEVVGLVSLREERLGTLSRGMDRRLGLACALLPDPHTLVLDDPADGLSAREARWLHGMLRAHATQGGTVLFTTADSKEAAREADRVVTLDGGRIVADQEARVFGRTRLRPRVAVRSPHAARLAAALAKEARTDQRSVEVVREGGNRLSVYGSTTADIGETAFRHGILVHQLADEVGDMGPRAEAGAGDAVRAAGEEVAAGPEQAVADRSPEGEAEAVSGSSSEERAAPPAQAASGLASAEQERVVSGVSTPEPEPESEEGVGDEWSSLGGVHAHNSSPGRTRIADGTPAEGLAQADTVSGTGRTSLGAAPGAAPTFPGAASAAADGAGSGAEAAAPAGAPAIAADTRPLAAALEADSSEASTDPGAEADTASTAVVGTLAVGATVPGARNPDARNPEVRSPDARYSDDRNSDVRNSGSPQPRAGQAGHAGHPARSHADSAPARDALSSLPPPISVRPARSPLRPLRYELRRATGIGTGFLTCGAVLVVSALIAVLLARLGHTPQARLFAAWPRELPLPPTALAAGLLGALAFGDEFRHPALAADRGTVPRRLGLLTAKLLVSGATALMLAFLTVGCNAEVLYLVYGRELTQVPSDWLSLSASWLGLVIGCAWAGVLAAGVFRSTTAGLAAVLAVPVLVVPAVHKALQGRAVRMATGFPVRMREVFLLDWPFGGERYLLAMARVLAQPVGGALTLSLAALLCAYLVTTLRARAR
ncbi:ATP-binding cassette domain-containing protein [Streptomyces diastatochromogenes]|uniref:ATP-binding cassette domain-containing protein n=1 Tax=Streptomyces diastatochromogenes TaxID=42236 RepID=UPI0036B3C8BD